MRGQSAHEIFEHWDIDRVDDANCILDAMGDAKARMNAAAEAAAKRQGQ
jgi:hypothetical protein